VAKHQRRLKLTAMKNDKTDRRAFIRGASKAALGTAATPLLCGGRPFGGEMANSKLNIAASGWAARCTL
jgi:hypothetical protein